MFNLKYLLPGLFILLLSLSGYGQGVSQTMTLQPHAGGTMYVEAVLADSVPVKLLLDTGASMLTVNRKIFKQLQQQSDLLYSHDVGLRNANGKIHKVKVYVLSRLTLGGACQVRDVELAVISRGNNILGMNVLSKFAPIGLSVQPPALELSNCGASLIAGRTVTDAPSQ